jgi:hypothetical protein
MILLNTVPRRNWNEMVMISFLLDFQWNKMLKYLFLKHVD